jgi:hypothetical protein
MPTLSTSGHAFLRVRALRTGRGGRAGRVRPVRDATRTVGPDLIGVGCIGRQIAIHERGHVGGCATVASEIAAIHLAPDCEARLVAAVVLPGERDLRRRVGRRRQPRRRRRGRQCSWSPPVSSAFRTKPFGHVSFRATSTSPVGRKQKVIASRANHARSRDGERRVFSSGRRRLAPAVDSASSATDPGRHGMASEPFVPALLRGLIFYLRHCRRTPVAPC